MFLFPPLAEAYRPFRTEDAGVAGRGVTQMELSWDYTRLDTAGGTRHLALLVAIHGVGERLEVSAEIPFLEERFSGGGSSQGLGDLQLVAKIFLRDASEHLPALTLKGTVKLDTGEVNRGLGTGDEDWSLFAVATRGFGPFTAHAHVGYAWLGKSGNPDLKDTWRYSGGVDLRLAPGRHFIAEISGNGNSLDPQGRDEREWRLGLIWGSSDDRQFDLTVRREFEASGDGWTAAAGMSLSF